MIPRYFLLSQARNGSIPCGTGGFVDVAWRCFRGILVTLGAALGDVDQTAPARRVGAISLGLGIGFVLRADGAAEHKSVLGLRTWPCIHAETSTTGHPSSSKTLHSHDFKSGSAGS